MPRRETLQTSPTLMFTITGGGGWTGIFCLSVFFPPPSSVCFFNLLLWFSSLDGDISVHHVLYGIFISYGNFWIPFDLQYSTIEAPSVKYLLTTVFLNREASNLIFAPSLPVTDQSDYSFLWCHLNSFNYHLWMFHKKTLIFVSKLWRKYP